MTDNYYGVLKMDMKVTWDFWTGQRYIFEIYEPRENGKEDRFVHSQTFWAHTDKGSKRQAKFILDEYKRKQQSNKVIIR